MKTKNFLILSISTSIVLAIVFTGCGQLNNMTTARKQPKSNTGVAQATTTVTTDAEGHTNEQVNIIRRLVVDNTPGALKHLYIISVMSGDVLLYSPVEGKVTSSGKRLEPKTVSAGRFRSGNYSSTSYGIPVFVNGTKHVTTEVPQADGTYGGSSEYIFWFTPSGVFHKHLLDGAQMVHISDQPLKVGHVTIDLSGADEDLIPETQPK